MAFKKKNIKALCIDFDGTIVESNSIKDGAFRKILSEYPDHRKQMMEYHLKNNLKDRNEKFSFFVRNILMQKENKKLIKILVTKFSILTDKAIKDCPYVNGANCFLEKNYKDVNVYLLSATPKINLIHILNSRKIDKYFKYIYGAPLNKTNIIKRIISKKKIKPNEVLYIGDTQEDLNTALETKINFIHRQSDRFLNENQFPSFKDFASIAKYVKNNFNFVKL